MSLPVIVYTPHEGRGVHFGIPAEECLSAMSCGGYWSHMPKGFVDVQIARQIRDGIDPNHARRFARAVAFGGCTTKEAISIIKDRDFARRGYDFALLDRDEIPQDRWFRDAWARNHNGAVCVDLEKARPIQWVRVRDASKAEERRRETDLSLWSRRVDVPWLSIEAAIRHASCEDELRRIWPEGLSAQKAARPNRSQDQKPRSETHVPLRSSF